MIRVALILAVLGLSACETVKGVGRDITRGAEAVECKRDTCTVAPWFVREARSNPTRMMGDVKVFTAPDDSGWLLGEVRSGSAAHAMGFRAGDVIRTIGGHP